MVALTLGAACKKTQRKTPPRRTTPRVASYTFGQVVHFGRGGDSDVYKRSGWGDTETEMTWTNSRSAVLVFTLPDSEKPLRLRMRLAGFTYSPELPYQPVEVYANDEKIADWQVSDIGNHVAIISPSVANHQQLYLELRMPRANSPKALKVGEDLRVLGVSCYELEMTEAGAELGAASDAQPPPAIEFGRAYNYGDVLTFGAGGGAYRYKVSGWYAAEKDFTWMGRDPGVIELEIQPTERPLILTMKLGGMVTPGALPLQDVEVFVNTERVAEWQVSLPAEFTARIPEEIARRGGLLNIQLCASKAVSPKEIGLGGDARALTLRCESLVIAEDLSAETKPSPKSSSLRRR